MLIQKASTNFTLIIFGASGNLAKLKLFPAVYDLFVQNRLGGVEFNVIGFSRSDFSDEEFRQRFRESVMNYFPIEINEAILGELLSRCFYVKGEYANADDYRRLLDKVTEVEKVKDSVRISYLSIPPSAFVSVVRNLNDNFNNGAKKQRIVLEKPFGKDLQTAKELELLLKANFSEQQIFLLDHYLGKEAIFNLLALRYANPILRKLFTPDLIANIQLTAYEDIGIGDRASYFDKVGIFRDMVQSHMLQMLALLLMDLPEEINAETVQRSKRHLLESLIIKDPKNSICVGQYEGYLKEKGVAVESKIETFAGLRVFLDNGQFSGVPIYLRSGKMLKEKLTRVVVEFKQTDLEKHEFNNVERNRLVIEIQPNETIKLGLNVKKAGDDFTVIENETSSELVCEGDCLTEHGRLLLEVMDGHRMLFLSFGEIFAAWDLVDEVNQVLEDDQLEVEKYKQGSLGPSCIESLVAQDGFTWYNN